jgi:hypothetical protein
MLASLTRRRSQALHHAGSAHCKHDPAEFLEPLAGVIPIGMKANFKNGGDDRDMKSKLNHATLFGAILSTLLSGCMMAPVQPEVPLLGSDLSVRTATPDQFKLVLVNTTSKVTHGVDNTGRINVRIDGKAVGGPNIGEYLQVEVSRGKHQLEVWHRDVINFRTKKEFVVEQDLFVQLKATPFSNDILVQSTMPDGNFRPHVIATQEERKNVFRRSTAALTSYVQSFR